ncbi:hypothetical protein LA080_009980 [Diaporthe eres]|nr:hypothetical protein LA080_009980 [Diaporthe eres]
MGRSKGARKKTGIKPWHSIYVPLNLPGLVDGVIPKRIRAIEGAKARLKTARSVRAARVEWRHIDTNLWAIHSAYSKIRTALRDGGDMHRWTEFPGLAAAVKQVNDLTWSDLQGGGIPGRPVKFHIPKFDDSPLTSDTKAVKSDHLATVPIKNRGSLHKRIKDEFEDELEEGEIRDEIKEETEDEQVVSLDIGAPEPHQHGYSYESGFGDCPPRSLLQSMPQSSVPHPDYPRVYWHGLPHHYSQPVFTPFYAIIPYYSIGIPSSGSDDSIRGKADTQFSDGANCPQLHASPPDFEPSTSTELPSTSYLGPVMTNQPESQRRDKRKLPTSADTSTSVPRRPLKRRRPVASDFWSDDDEAQYNRSNHTLPANGMSDFGSWFQERVTGSKKKLSHLEHVSKPTSNKMGS